MKKQLIVTAVALTAAGTIFTAVNADSLPCSIQAVQSDEKCSVTVKNSSSAEMGYLYTTVYKNGAITGINLQPIEINAGNNSFTAALPASYDADSDVRIFLWNSQQKPLAESASPIDDRLEPPVVTQSSLDNKVEDYYKDYYQISFEGDEDNIKTYLAAVTSVTVGERNYEYKSGSSFYSSDSYKYKMGSYYSAYSLEYVYLDLTADGIPDFDAATTITVAAEGYKNLTFTIDHSDIHPSAAPTVSNTELYYGSSKDFYRVSFSGMESSALSDYLSNITSVTVGNTSYSSSSSFYSSTTNAYKLYYESYRTYINLDLTDDAIAQSGVTTVTVVSTGYEDLTFTIDNSDYTPDAALTVASTILNYGSPNYYRVTFNGSDTDVTTYLSRITSVMVGDTQYSSTDYFYSSYTSRYKLSHNGSYYIYLDLTTDAIAEKGITDIVIKSKGYEDLSFTIDNNNVQLATPPTYSSSGAKDAAGSYYQNYYQISFDAEDSEISTYLSRVTSVKAGNNSYQKYDYFYDSYSYLYRFNSNKYLEMTADGILENGKTTVVITANGYEDLTFVIDNGDEENTSDDSTPSDDEGEKEAAGFAPSSIYHDAGGYYGNYQLSYDDSSAVTWLTKITSVVVNDTTYSKASDYYVSYYKSNFYCSSSSLWLSADKFVNGNNTITVTATGYKTITMTVNVDDNGYATVTSIS